MKPAPLEYLAPPSVEAAVAALERYDGDARVLAGGQSLVPMLTMRLAQPAAVVDLSRIVGLDAIRAEDGAVRIGALARYAALAASPLVAHHLPLLSEAVRLVGDPQVRNRGTIGGSLAHADPSGETPLAALVLSASVVARGPGGSREIPVSQLLRGPYETDLSSSEIITEVVFPDAAGTRCAITEHVRRHGDFAVVAVAVTGRPGPAGRWSGVRIGVSGAGLRPYLFDAAASGWEGSTLADEQIAAAAAGCLAQADPASDVRASAAYRGHLVPVYVERALRRLRDQREPPP